MLISLQNSASSQLKRSESQSATSQTTIMSEEREDISARVGETAHETKKRLQTVQIRTYEYPMSQTEKEHEDSLQIQPQKKKVPIASSSSSSSSTAANLDISDAEKEKILVQHRTADIQQRESVEVLLPWESDEDEADVGVPTDGYLPGLSFY